MSHYIEIVQTTFQTAIPQADRISQVFYQRLFAIAPSSRALFPEDMSAQRQKLMQTLAFVVDHLAEPDVFRSQVVTLGIRHVAYGTQPIHYALVRTALMQTLAEIFGSAFDARVETAWNEAYDQIEALMLEGHHSVPALS